MAKFLTYGIYNCDSRLAEQLHNQITSWHDNLLTDRKLQHQFFGHEINSYFEITTPVFNRTKIMGHLLTVQELIEHATKPSITVINYAVNGDSSKTIDGLDEEVMESVQRSWFTDPIVPKIRAYESALNEAFAEYNFQTILNAVSRHQDELRCEAFDLRSTLKQVGRPLENAYYNRGNWNSNSAGQLWAELQSSEYGKKFTLSPDEARQWLQQVMTQR